MCFKLEIIKKIIGVSLVLISMKISVHAIAVSAALFGLISMIINIIPNKKLIGYSILEMAVDMAPSLGIALIMGGVVWLVSLINVSTIISLSLQVVVGAATYIGLAVISKNDSLSYLLATVKQMLHKK